MRSWMTELLLSEPDVKLSSTFRSGDSRTTHGASHPRASFSSSCTKCRPRFPGICDLGGASLTPAGRTMIDGATRLISTLPGPLIDLYDDHGRNASRLAATLER